MVDEETVVEKVAWLILGGTTWAAVMLVALVLVLRAERRRPSTPVGLPVSGSPQPADAPR